MTDEEALEQLREDLWAARMRGVTWSEIRVEATNAEAEENDHLYQERLDRESYGDPDEWYDNARMGERGLLG